MASHQHGESVKVGNAVRRWRLTSGDLLRALIALFAGALGLWVASWLVPGFDVGGPKGALFASLAVAVWGFVLRPVMVRLTVPLGWIGAGLVGLFGQALILMVATTWLGDQDNSLLTSVIASWVVAAVAMAFLWVATAGTADAATALILRRARLRPVTVSDPEVPGILFVQADGVPFPVLEWSIRAGTLPTFSRWVREGSHHLNEWRPKLPATTPASQMGILHGSIEGIPAFRWVNRGEGGRIYVANRPADAALIEARHSNGLGLLADDGVSVSNLFTGDAPTAYATMSAIARTQETRETRLALSTYLAGPTGFARAIPRMIAEVVKERFQSLRAVRRDVRPRVHRGWDFTFERAALAGLLSDLNTSLVADSLLKGRHSVYVNYVDYDAIAHHVGMVRPEAQDALAGLDAVLGRLEKIVAVAPRKYHIVVLSDHGQAQGAIFADRYGEDLATLVARLAETKVEAADDMHEGLGSLNSMIASSASTESVIGRALDRTSNKIAQDSFADTKEDPGAAARDDEERFIVFGSGNLGLVYVAGEDHRLTREELDARFPALVSGLAAHPGVGFVVVDTAAHGPVAFGVRGEHRLRSGEVVGEDPLVPFGPQAPGFVLRASSMPETPDLYVNSLVDELGEVAAFEGLVGCHGGLGGWQDRASLVWPDELPEPEAHHGPDGMIVGADALHDVLVGWLEHLGHRQNLKTPSA